MKKTLIVLLTALMVVSLFVSCGSDPFFHYVEFDSNGGTAVERQTVRNGEKASKPDNPTKDGTEFLGWYDGENVFDFNTEITKDYKLTAKWADGSGSNPGESTSSSHTVTFALNGGTGSGCENQTIEAGGKATKPATDPKLTNAIFKFWSADGTNAFDFDSVITEDTTLTAVWQTTFQVGDTGPAGGIIFYVAPSEQTSTYTDSSGQKELKWKYLEVASGEGTFNGSDRIQWSTLDTGFYSSSATAIGSGLSNTFKLLSFSGVTFPAAQACADYGNNTDYDDWFLPSKDELNKIYENRDVLNTTFKTGECEYWSSSETSGNGTWRLNFSAGTWNNQVDRTIAWYVRPIRAFL